jgi:hypothetical protein
LVDGGAERDSVPSGSLTAFGFEATEVVANPRAGFVMGFLFFFVGAIASCHGCDVVDLLVTEFEVLT